MVTLSIAGDRLHLDVQGRDKLWALKSTLDIPLSHISSVRADPEPARGWFHGLRSPGTEIPGVIMAGTFYNSAGIVFYDVHDPDKTVVLELNHDHYDRLVIEVEDPSAAVALLNPLIGTRK